MLEPKNSDRWNLQETVQTEVGLNEELERSHDDLDDEWDKERDKLANIPFPEPALGSSTSIGRSIPQEYESRRTSHMQKRDAVNSFFAQLRGQVRESGTTLSNTFAHATHNHSNPDPALPNNTASTTFNEATHTPPEPQPVQANSIPEANVNTPTLGNSFSRFR